MHQERSPSLPLFDSSNVTDKQNLMVNGGSHDMYQVNISIFTTLFAIKLRMDKIASIGQAKRRENEGDHTIISWSPISSDIFNVSQ